MVSLILKKEPLALKNENVKDNLVNKREKEASKGEPYS
jgi:hypothetical protein